MIIWLNGTFGVGKTTTARLVCRRTEWRLFDPEQVGYMLAANLSDVEVRDFQDLPPWRSLVPAVAEEIHRYTGHALVAVQTVLDEEYWNELTTNFERRGLEVFHVLLDAQPDELRRRIEADEAEPGAKEWRLGHIDGFARARDWLVRSANLVVDTTNATPDAVARTVVATANEQAYR